jgi:Mu transposase, C-terminal
VRGKPTLTPAEFDNRFRVFLLGVYHHRENAETKMPPLERWEATGFLPRMPDSLEQLDLLPVQVAKARQVRPDGIHFQSLRYVSTTLAAYVGETVTLRFKRQQVGSSRRPPIQGPPRYSLAAAGAGLRQIACKGLRHLICKVTLNQIQHPACGAAFGFDPKTKVLPELRLNDRDPLRISLRLESLDAVPLPYQVWSALAPLAATPIGEAVRCAATVTDVPFP